MMVGWLARFVVVRGTVVNNRVAHTCHRQHDRRKLRNLADPSSADLYAPALGTFVMLHREG